MRGLLSRRFFSFLSKSNNNTGTAASVFEEVSPSIASPEGLMCEFLQAHQQDIKIKTRSPKFSWVAGDTAAGAVQHAYQLLVADSREKIDQHVGNLWNSGKVISSQSINIPYAGKNLRTDATYYWKVRTWNQAGEVSHYAEPQAFCIEKEKGISHYRLEKHEVPPVLVERIADEVTFIDFGKAAFGTLALTLYSDEEGRIIEIHLGEVLQAPQQIHRAPGGARRYRKIELSLQKGAHSYTLEIAPDARNTRKKAISMPAYIGEVMPFRYCEVVNYAGEVGPEDVRQIAVHYPFDDTTADFHADDPVLKDVWALCKYTIKATSFTGIYVDGDRERVPYESDAYINQLSHYATDREFSMARRSIVYLLEHATWPTEWILHTVLMAHADYMHTGDLALVKKHYRLLTKKTLMMLARPDGLISTRTGKATRSVEKAIRYDARMFKGKPLKDIVDWPHGSSLGLGEDDPGETDGFEFCDINTVVNAFHYRTLVLMARMAADLGKHQDAAFFKTRAAKVKAAFNDKLLNHQEGIYTDGEGSQHSSLHANMFPLAFGLVPEAYMSSVVSFIKSRGMACSVYGAQYLLEALYKAGEGEYAAELMTSKAERSWAHMIYEVGTTMTLEAWDDRFKPNQDWNHAWGTAPANIIPRYLMGIRPLAPGFGKVLIQPQPGHIQQASVKLPTIRGTVHAAFEKKQDTFQLQVRLPANMSARIALPAEASATQLSWNNQGVELIREGKFVFLDNIGAGTHTIVVV